MAVRAVENLTNACIMDFTVASGQAATLGKCVKFSGDDNEIALSGATDVDTIGVALSTQTAGERVQVCMLTGGCVVKVLVGTGGATRGKYAIVTTDGVTDQTLGGGTTVKYIVGKFVQSGSAGDYVGMIPIGFAGGAS